MTKCPKCQSEKVYCNIDWLREAEEEVSTYECEDCRNFWLGHLI